MKLLYGIVGFALGAVIGEEVGALLGAAIGVLFAMMKIDRDRITALEAALKRFTKTR